MRTQQNMYCKNWDARHIGACARQDEGDQKIDPMVRSKLLGAAGARTAHIYNDSKTFILSQATFYSDTDAAAVSAAAATVFTTIFTVVPAPAAASVSE